MRLLPRTTSVIHTLSALAFRRPPPFYCPSSRPTMRYYSIMNSTPITRLNHQYHSDSDDDGSSVSSNDSDKRIRLPILKYGYRTEPLEWEEIVDIIVIEKDLAKLSRSVEQQRDYEVYKRDLLKNWKTVMDHVLYAKFPHVFDKKEEDPTTTTDGLYVAYPPLTEVAMSGIVETTLVKNDFPYYMADGIEHYVFWKLGGLCSDHEIKMAETTLRRDHGALDVIHWVNPPHLKSLPEIDHVHFLIRLGR